MRWITTHDEKGFHHAQGEARYIQKQNTHRYFCINNNNNFDSGDFMSETNETTLLEDIQNLKKLHDEFIEKLKELSNPNNESNHPAKWWNR